MEMSRQCGGEGEILPLSLLDNFPTTFATFSYPTKRHIVKESQSPLTKQLSSKIPHTIYNIEHYCLCLRPKKTAMWLRHALQKENWKFSKIATEKIEIKFLESELPI